MTQTTVVEFKPVLARTLSKSKNSQDRINVHPESNNRQSIVKIPKKYEALLVMVADAGVDAGLLLTKEELDINPRTRNLNEKEKNALIKYSPAFFRQLEDAREIKRIRAEEIAYALEAQKRANALAISEGMDKMELAEQLTATTHVFHKQIYKASLSLAATDIEMIHSDPLSRELYKDRVQYVKDFLKIANDIGDLSARISESAAVNPHLSSLTDEALEQLNRADEILLNRGIKKSEKGSGLGEV